MPTNSRAHKDDKYTHHHHKKGDDDDEKERYHRRRSRSHSRHRNSERQRTRSRTPERQSRRHNRRNGSRTPERRRRSRSHDGISNNDNRYREHRNTSGRRHKDYDYNSRSRSRSGSRKRTRTASSNSAAGGGGGGSTSKRRHSRDGHHSHKRSDYSNSSASGNSDNKTINTNNTSSGVGQNSTSVTDSVGAYYNLDTDEPFDKERIHREMEAKLRETLAREGKVYPPPKVEASHPVFANDGSFLELFKKMQQGGGGGGNGIANAITSANIHAAPPTAAIFASAAMAATSGITAIRAPILMNGINMTQTVMHHMPNLPPTHIAMPPLSQLPVVLPTNATGYLNIAKPTPPPPPPPPLVGRRRGGKILKTGMVAKQKTQTGDNADPKDFWSLYLAEVNKYKSNACETDGGKRPLVK